MTERDAFLHQKPLLSNYCGMGIPRNITAFYNRAHISKELPIIAVCPELITKQCLYGESEGSAFRNLAVTTIVNSFCHAYMDLDGLFPTDKVFATIERAMSHVMLSECVANNQEQSGNFENLIGLQFYNYEIVPTFLYTNSIILAADLKNSLWNPDDKDGECLYDKWAKLRNDVDSAFYKEIVGHYNKMEEYFSAHNKISPELVEIMLSFQLY